MHQRERTACALLVKLRRNAEEEAAPPAETCEGSSFTDKRISLRDASCVQTQKIPRKTNLLNPERHVSSAFPVCRVSPCLRGLDMSGRPVGLRPSSGANEVKQFQRLAEAPKRASNGGIVWGEFF